jgi:hypothetical protein
LDTSTPLVQLWNAVTGVYLLGEITVIDVNTVRVRFTSNPGNSINVVVGAGVPASGGGGGQILAFHYVQAVAATSWVINHNLTFQPNVTAIDSAHTQIFPGSVQYTGAQQVTLGFSAAVAGEAYLS